jgi:hypothetical protein
MSPTVVNELVHKCDIVYHLAAAVGVRLIAGHLDLRVLSVPDFYEHAFGRVPVEHVAPAWFMSVVHLHRRPYPRVVKRLFDVPSRCSCSC